jgi:hypothetical protein
MDIDSRRTANQRNAEQEAQAGPARIEGAADQSLEQLRVVA